MKQTKLIPDSIFGFQLIEEILQTLGDEGIDYCVLRNSDGILGKFPSGDVDVLVSGGMSTFRKIHNVIHHLQSDFGFVIYARNNHANVSTNIYLSTMVGGGLYTINLEFFNQVFVYQYRKIKSKKFTYLNTKKILQTKKKKNAIFSSSKDFEIVHKVVDSLFNDKSAYFTWLNNEIKKNSSEDTFREISLETLGDRAANDLVDVNWASEEPYQRDDLKRSIFEFLKEKRKLPFFSDLTRDFFSLFQHIKQYLYCKGLFCLVLGTDGSGKTTVCDSISQRRNRSFNKIHRIHLGNRPILLPSWRGEKISNAENQVIDQVHKNFHEYDLGPKSHSIYQSFRFMYTTADFILHYWLVMRPLLGRGDLILTERYFTDYIIIPERYFPLVPKWLKILCYRLVPKPHITIHLSTEMTEIVARKKELSLHLLEHEIDQFKKYSMANHFTVISNSGDIAKAIDGIEKIIFSREVLR